jgi:hypothetical protein
MHQIVPSCANADYESCGLLSIQIDDRVSKFEFNDLIKIYWQKSSTVAEPIGALQNTKLGKANFDNVEIENKNNWDDDEANEHRAVGWRQQINCLKESQRLQKCVSTEIGQIFTTLNL